MRINSKGEYALYALLDLAYHYQDKSVVPLTQISKKRNIPIRYLEQIMLILKGAGYVESRRGSSGGFSLIKSPSEITLGDIIRLVQGESDPFPKQKNTSDAICSNSDYCAFQEVWLKVVDTIARVIDNVTFSDIMRRSEEIKAEQIGYTYQI